MEAAEIEAWAIKCIDSAIANGPHEDDRVEMKRQWVPAEKAARQLAGQANGAAGQLIMWLIGVEKGQPVIGASDVEVRPWIQELEKYFHNKFAPNLIRHINVPHSGKMVVALLFETDRRPYVWIRDGNDNLDVPWRNGAHTRSARRDELLRMLAPLSHIPEVTPIFAEITHHINGGEGIPMDATIEFYVASASQEVVALPPHQVRLEVKTVDKNFTFLNCELFENRYRNQDIDRSGLILDTPRIVAVCVQAKQLGDVSGYPELVLAYSLRFTHTAVPVKGQVVLQKIGNKWQWKKDLNDYHK